ncbi:SLS1 [Candida pseudojiufengensis]|uniref:SLS1 n=1 Tax=Candida pseudojiufengensis TaxID=497109 RepID=UPI002224F807|nr:SLS1 [Candida pseudojiufengensis]KAI5958708.1 SLS1 [Candida pseudojiufengensis]
MITRHLNLNKNFTRLIRQFSTQNICFNEKSPTTSPEIELPYDKSKRIFLKPGQIRNRKRKSNKTKLTSPPSSSSILRQSIKQPPKVNLNIFSEIYENKLNSVNEDGDLFKHIASFKPFEKTIGLKRFDNLKKNLDDSFTKTQLLKYVNNLTTSKKLTKKTTKNDLIEKLILNYWKINKSTDSKSISNEIILNNRVFDLTPEERFLIEPIRSKFLKNLVNSLNLNLNFTNTKLIVSGMTSNLNFFEAELVSFKNNLKYEEITIPNFINLNDLNFGRISKTSSVFFKEIQNNKYQIIANSLSNIDLAKRLISWSIDKNPHVKTTYFNEDQMDNRTCIPYLNNDIWSWYDKQFQYYHISKDTVDDKKPGRLFGNEIIFEKFDKMNDNHLNSKHLDDLIDTNLSLKFEEPNADDYVDKSISDDILNMFKGVKPSNHAESEFNLDKVIQNRANSANLNSDNDPKHLNLEELRHELGKFSEQEYDPNEFPDVSNLIVDVEGQDQNKNNDQIIDNLRTELGAYGEEDSSLGLFDDLLEDTDTFTTTPASVVEEPKLQPVKEHPISERVNKFDSQFTDDQIKTIYDKLNDTSFTNDLKGTSKESELYSAFTIQFGSLLLKKPKLNNDLLPPPLKVTTSENNQYKLLTNVPFLKDQVINLPVLYNNGTQIFTNKVQINLSPSIFKNSDLKDVNKYPSIEIQVELNDWGQLKLESLKILSIESMNQVDVFCPNMIYDLRISKLSIGDLLQPQGTIQQIESQKDDNSIDDNYKMFQNQPDLINFLKNSNLNFSSNSKSKINVPNSVNLQINGVNVIYDFLHLTYETDLNFEFAGNKEIILSIIEGGSLNGKTFEILIGENGNLNEKEFKTFINDAIQFLNELS